MKGKILRIIISAAILALVGYIYRGPILNTFEYLQSYYRPCQQPIEYSLGTFDTRFGISKADFLKVVDQAAVIWEKPINKDLFKYAEGGSLVINLIYDSRQASTQKLQQIGITINNDQASYDRLKATYNSMINSYDKQKVSLDAMIKEYEELKASYEEEVNYWNKRGGAPESEYGKLEQERIRLNELAITINQAQTALNKLVDEINAVVNVLNQLAHNLNLSVNTYNNIGAQQGAEFEEGLYKRDASGTSIDIYQFESRDKLLRVLAHELGHALGLDHVDDPKAIMYRLNESGNEKATQADLSELRRVCKIKSS